MEQDLFDWEDWAQLDTASFQFYSITLKVPIGTFKAGETLAVAVVDFEHGVLSLFATDTDEVPVLTAKLGLTIKEVQ